MNVVLRILAALAVSTLLAAGALTLGMVAAELTVRHDTATQASQLPAEYPAAVPDACDRAALARAQAVTPDLGITMFWADLERRGAVGLAYWDTRRVLLDPDLDCADVPKVWFHEWTHIATSVYYGGENALTGTVPGLPDETGRPRTLKVDEVIADCGAALLSVRHGERFEHHAYWDLAGGCPPDLLERTRLILEAAGIPTVDGLVLPPGPVGSGVA